MLRKKRYPHESDNLAPQVQRVYLKYLVQMLKSDPTLQVVCKDVSRLEECRNCCV